MNEFLSKETEQFSATADMNPSPMQSSPAQSVEDAINLAFFGPQEQSAAPSPDPQPIEPIAMPLQQPAEPMPVAAPAAPQTPVPKHAGKPLIEFKGVYKMYENGTKALSDVNLQIHKGEFVFVVGASGAGKSTFIKLLTHEESPNAGEILVNGFRMSSIKRRDVPKLRRTMGIVFQDFRLIPTMTVFENVAFAMRVTGASSRTIRKRVSYALSIVGLGDKARNLPTELSGGEQQRVGLARALVNNPTMNIADEPTGNVDPNMSYEIVELLMEINRRGTTIIMVTHEHQLVRDFGRRVIMIEHGNIVADNENGGGAQ